ncbi:hypothetical protein BC831DRAFT_510893 [Entophlyctis helioformis]|nr:hypothetical protein BC831DRAFT_510893 [Entophlyctis helioformis]
MPTINSLPLEVLSAILSHLAFEDKFPKLSLVHSRWRACLKDSRAIKVKATEATKRIGLQNIVDSFPLLEELHLDASYRNASTTKDNSKLVHEVAQQFNGHPRLRVLESASDLVVRGVMYGCPRLEVLRLPAEPMSYSDDEDSMFEIGSDSSLIAGQLSARPYNPDTLGPRGRRNVGLMLRTVPSLRRLEVDGPSFWRREAVPHIGGLGMDLGSSAAQALFASCVPFRTTPPASSLQSLKMTSISSWTLVNLLNWLGNATHGPRMPELRHLHLDIDYLHFPQHGIKDIAAGCPNLESLKIKFGMMPRDALFDIATHMRSLRSLSLSKCDVWFVSQSWSHLTVFLASNLPCIEKMSFNSASIQTLDDPHWHSLFDSLMATVGGPASLDSLAGLRHLKILDTSDSRPDATVLHTVAVAFPKLESLRLDVTADCFPAWDRVYLDNIRKGFRHLQRLELRAGKFSGDPEKLFHPSMSSGFVEQMPADQSIHMPALRHLSLWCFPSFPHHLIHPNTATIEHLVLNYPVLTPASHDGATTADPSDGRPLLNRERDQPEAIRDDEQPSDDEDPETLLARFDSPTPSNASLPSSLDSASPKLVPLPTPASWLPAQDTQAPQYDFARLQTLEIRGLSAAAHNICLAALDLVLGSKPHSRLAHISLDALSRLNAPLPAKVLAKLAASTPNLSHFRTSNFILPMDGMAILRDSWPHLQSLEILGSHSVPSITRDFETAELAPLLDSHRSLQKLGLGVSGLSLPGYELMNSDTLRSRLSMRGNVGPDDFSGEFVHMVQTANLAIYRRYETELMRRYEWLRACTIRGPFDMGH